MTLKAGFSQVEITPPQLPIRTYFASADEVMDPLYVCAAAFADGDDVAVFISFDVVIVEWAYVERVRQGIVAIAQERLGGEAAAQLAAEKILVCATHNHACPAVVDRPGSAKDEDYLDFMVERGIEAGAAALERMCPGELGVGRGYEVRVGHNRRYIKLDGTVVSQPASTDDLLCSEGVTDPGLGVVCFREAATGQRHTLVNYSCHVCHHMGQLSAGYPGVMRNALREELGAGSVCVFLNGACGNLLHRDYADPTLDLSKERCGAILAEDVAGIVAGLAYRAEARVASREAVVPIAYREIDGLAANIDRLVEEYNVFTSVYERGWYQRSLELLTELHAEADHEPAHVQALHVGDAFFGTVPAEYFAENGLRIKLLSPVERTTFVVSLANGWVGYIPHPAAFERQGGHETTWALWSKMAVDAGDILGDAVVALLEDLA